MLGEYHIERIYMIILLIVTFLGQDKRLIPSSVTRYVVLFFLAMIMSTATALYFFKAYDATYEYFKLLVFYFLIILTIKDKKQLRNFVLAFLIIMLLYVGKSAWEFFIHGRHVYRMGISRMIGIDTTYGDANSFSASIVYSLPFLWVMLRDKYLSPWIKRLLLIYALLAPVCIIYTGSRSGMVTAILFLVLIWASSRKKIKGVVLLAFILAIAWTIMPQDYQNRFMSTFVKGEGRYAESAAFSANSRIDGLKHGYRLFLDYPILGVGPGNFTYSWGRGMNAHNLYGQMLGELGLVGTLAFLMLIFSIYSVHKNIVKTVDAELGRMSGSDDKDITLFKYLSVASIQVLILLLFNGNFGHNLYRYNWLWIGAIGLLAQHMLKQQIEKADNHVR